MSSKQLEKVRHCQIHLKEPARTAAAEATFPKAGVPAYDIGAERNRREFTGPHFHAVDRVDFEEGCVLVSIDDTQYIYPMAEVARVKLYTTTHTPE
ncbi:hypothetical protein [Pseudomonas phage Bertil]|uniref:Uncharacterized protein n=1 Tax=Pseudomonas phage Bertil TaxID=2801385 RepID=A0A7T8EQE6_9CAUD|nr:hypothetical protein [Pseudomonas phage Bertil]QQO90879.1 hypothetical protein [Pseudomonas phage Strit]